MESLTTLGFAWMPQLLRLSVGLAIWWGGIYLLYKHAISMKYVKRALMKHISKEGGCVVRDDVPWEANLRMIGIPLTLAGVEAAYAEIGRRFGENGFLFNIIRKEQTVILSSARAQALAQLNSTRRTTAKRSKSTAMVHVRMSKGRNKGNWRSILGIPEDINDFGTVKSAFRRKAMSAHSDRNGGDDQAMAAFNTALSQAKKELTEPVRKRKTKRERMERPLN